MRESLQFGNKKIGAEEPCYIVLEAGPTHYGLESAIALVNIAADAGVDAIKFQIGDAKRLVPNSDTTISYTYLVNKHTGETATITESLQKILLRRQLTTDEWKKVAELCKTRGLMFFATVFDVEDLTLLRELAVDCVKICSGDINYHYLLQQAARYPWIIQIDTGSSTIGEVEQAVDVLERSGCDQIIINHCPSGYPAHLESINLRVIQTLHAMFPYPIAFSDHTPGVSMDVAALAMGADMIEKTITLDKTIQSPEHIMSLEPEEVASFIKTLREVEIALGKPRRVKSEKELMAIPTGRRSIVAAQDIGLGTLLQQEHIAYARPGVGLAPNMDTYILGKKSRRIITKGELFSISDVEEPYNQ